MAPPLRQTVRACSPERLAPTLRIARRGVTPPLEPRNPLALSLSCAGTRARSLLPSPTQRGRRRPGLVVSCPPCLSLPWPLPSLSGARPHHPPLLTFVLCVGACQLRSYLFAMCPVPCASFAWCHRHRALSDNRSASAWGSVRPSGAPGHALPCALCLVPCVPPHDLWPLALCLASTGPGGTPFQRPPGSCLLLLLLLRLGQATAASSSSPPCPLLPNSWGLVGYVRLWRPGILHHSQSSRVGHRARLFGEVAWGAPVSNPCLCVGGLQSPSSAAGAPLLCRGGHTVPGGGRGGSWLLCVRWVRGTPGSLL